MGFSESTPWSLTPSPGTTAELDSSPEPGSCDLFTAADVPDPLQTLNWVGKTGFGWTIHQINYNTGSLATSLVTELYDQFGMLRHRFVAPQ